jgi:hypothetical protein
MFNHRVVEKLCQFAKCITSDRIINIATAAATVVATIALIIAVRQLKVAASQLEVTALQYQDQERTGRLERTYKFMDAAGNYLNAEERKQLIIQFPGRWEKDVQFCLSRDEADRFLQVALEADRYSKHPEKDSDQYKRWNLARKHLNQVETLAFPYFHNLIDREILAASACESMAKSYKYFRQLIEVFGVYLGGGQSWQVIPTVVKLMDKDYGPACQHFRAGQDPPKVAHDLPEARKKPGSGEERCRN